MVVGNLVGDEHIALLRIDHGMELKVHIVEVKAIEYDRVLSAGNLGQANLAITGGEGGGIALGC